MDWRNRNKEQHRHRHGESNRQEVTENQRQKRALMALAKHGKAIACGLLAMKAKRGSSGW